eukprot:GHVU01163517.1.p2 GENE.GHVU01163517.1~~GHVU01163517.1.p2  ORF type:complete len:114 (+),score=12.25 GHVU01163517.1:331-672(+)
MSQQWADQWSRIYGQTLDRPSKQEPSVQWGIRRRRHIALQYAAIANNNRITCKRFGASTPQALQEAPAMVTTTMRMGTIIHANHQPTRIASDEAREAVVHTTARRHLEGGDPQ